MIDDQPVQQNSDRFETHSEASRIFGYGTRAPEFNMNQDEIGFQSDVYGIGVIAY